VWTALRNVQDFPSRYWWKLKKMIFVASSDNMLGKRSDAGMASLTNIGVRNAFCSHL